MICKEFLDKFYIEATETQEGFICKEKMRLSVAQTLMPIGERIFTDVGWFQATQYKEENGYIIVFGFQKL